MGCNPFPPWVEWRRWSPVGFNDWPQIQCVKPKAKGWGRLNLICNLKEKTSEHRQKHGMIG